MSTTNEQSPGSRKDDPGDEKGGHYEDGKCVADQLQIHMPVMACSYSGRQLPLFDPETDPQTQR